MKVAKITDTREIKLTRGYVAVVDSEDWEYLKEYKWRASSTTENNKTVYAIRDEWNGSRKNRKTISMHRTIMDAKKGEQIDHRDGNGLNNCKYNLRKATSGQNCSNVKKRLMKDGKAVTSRYKGVHWHKVNEAWIASIRYNKKLIHIGSFKDEDKAGKAYDQKAKELFGEFSVLNFKEKTQ